MAEIDRHLSKQDRATQEWGLRNAYDRIWRMPDRETAVDGMFPGDVLVVRDRVKPHGIGPSAESEWGPWRPADTEEERKT